MKNFLCERSRIQKLNFGGQKEERTGGGDVTPELVTVAEKIAEMFPDAIFTALNDKYHQNDPNLKNSKHRIGKALDLVLGKNAPQNADQALAIKAQLRELMGVSRVKDEYFTEKGGTGKHFHVEVAKEQSVLQREHTGIKIANTHFYHLYGMASQDMNVFWFEAFTDGYMIFYLNDCLTPEQLKVTDEFTMIGVTSALHVEKPVAKYDNGDSTYTQVVSSTQPQVIEGSMNLPKTKISKKNR